MTKLATLDDLLIHEMQDIYDAEHQILKALPKLAEATSSDALRNAFQAHLKETEGQVQRLEQAFSALGKSARGTKCDGMAGLLKEGSKLLGEDAAPEVLDAALIAAAQKVEHYEIAAYGCIATYAQMLGRNELRDLFTQTLEEEEAADEKLTHLAESLINIRAEHAPASER
jgi:ferritin-like metal-binding protein YciE